LEDRKQDHIDLTSKSQVSPNELDNRFYYEPLLNGHPKRNDNADYEFLGQKFGFPMWVSSMTGGTEKAADINKNLALACHEFKLGMGLGSCRILLENEDRLKDFVVRKYIGDRPLFANLGIAQLESLIEEDNLKSLVTLIDKLEANGIIIHINPLQEWIQPEGDRYFKSPIESIEKLLSIGDVQVIVKEVGQGMGPASLKQLMKLPLKAIEFGAAGGTNFSKMEALRNTSENENLHSSLIRIGHTADEMIGFINDIMESSPKNEILCREMIISGGVRDYLDGYYLRNKLKLNSVYAQASALLRPAMLSYEHLQRYIQSQEDGYRLASNLLVPKL